MRKTNALALATLLLLLVGCATRPTNPEAFSFAVMGDTPYLQSEVAPYLAMLKKLDTEPIAFTIHVGDIISGAGLCTDEIYLQRKAEFDASAHPFIYTPGDNEWTDCRRSKRDSLERLARLRQIFFADRYSMGQKKLEMSIQENSVDPSAGCGAYPENRYWSVSGVRFVTLNIPGSDNNIGFDAASDAEAQCRNRANAAWLERAIRASERTETRALVIAIQADPWATKKPVYRAFMAQVVEASRRIRKPVLFVHGDSHTLTIDTPFRDSLGNALLGITRLETYGSPFVGYVKVSVDPDNPEVFTFEPKQQAFAIP